MQGGSADMKTSLSSSNLHRGTAIVAFLFAVLSGHQVRAGEESSWALLGFSEDGAYAAVEVFGGSANGASPFSMIRIIDTKANQFAAPPITTCVGQGCEAPKTASPTQKEVRTLNRQKAKETLARFRIDVNAQGERSKLSAKQRTSGDHDPEGRGLARETAQFRWLGANWTLVLQEVPIPGGGEGGHERARMIDLRAQRDGTEIILQKDRTLPKSRGAGIYWYDLDTVITYKNSLLVVLRHARPGRQGPDVTQLFVTAGAI
jgi:predicted secreted protein